MKKDIKISPKIKNILVGKKVTKDINHKKEYKDYISKKYSSTDNRPKR
ncbi:MAG TPA: hypothetical protein PLG90_06575 [Ignavibacteria bacterium]|nr:hypothetical protein [Ignavibacteria bacterium]